LNCAAWPIWGNVKRGLFSPTNITNEIHRTRYSCLLQHISVQEFNSNIKFILFLSNLWQA
jgi:hypothetical protein